MRAVSKDGRRRRAAILRDGHAQQAARDLLVRNWVRAPELASGSQRFEIDSIAKMFETFNQALGVCGLGPADEVVGTEVLVESSSFASRAAPPARSIV